MSDYGAKASADLIVTRGKGFTKEKNKKKRYAPSPTPIQLWTRSLTASVIAGEATVVERSPCRATRSSSERLEGLPEIRGAACGCLCI